MLWLRQNPDGSSWSADRKTGWRFDEVAPTVTTTGFGRRSLGHWWVEDDGEPDVTVAATEKPPYRIPTMSEIAGLEPNGLTVCSTFSGCGGSCLGFRMAGYRTVYASEFIPAAAETYRANHPGVPLDERDVREVTGDSIRELAGVDEVDVLEGSPPCASFSTAGRRAAHWGREKRYSDTVQRTDDLFFEYVRLVRELRPRVFVAENVSGLVKGVAKGYFKRIHAAFVESGYRVEARLLDAQWLGVPQTRQRVIFVGVRDDLGRDPVFPTPLPYRYSIRDAVAGLPPAELGEAALGNAIGVEWDKLRAGESSDRYFNLVRPNPDAPVPTVTQAGGNLGLASVTHPTERRKFTIPELRRLCGFPDDFVLTGSYAQQWERLGRAVPPPMMSHVARRIAESILD